MANPNPSPSTRFGAEDGNPNNIGGKTKAQRESEYKSAEMAALLREKALSVMLERVDGQEIDILDLIDANALKLFKDSEDRAHGTPKATIAGDEDNPLAMALTVTTQIVDGD